MIDTTLLDIAKLAAVQPSRTVVNPGDLVSATLVLPLPGNSPALGDFAYSVDVRWLVARGARAPALDVDGFVTNLGALNLATLGTDYIAPAGITGTIVVFGLMPPFGGAAPGPVPHWLIADFILRRPGLVSAATIGQLRHPATRASSQITVNGLSNADIADRILGLFKVEVPPVPLEPGAGLVARLRVRGAEDAAWDVEGATEIAPQFDLAAKIPLEPLFRPLSRIVNEVFGVGNQILGTALPPTCFWVDLVATKDSSQKTTGPAHEERSENRQSRERLLRQSRHQTLFGKPFLSFVFRHAGAVSVGQRAHP